MTIEREFAKSLPRGWPKKVRSAVVHVVSLANAAVTTSRGWAANHWNARVRLKVENERLRQEVGLLREEHRIKDARMGRIPAHERPHYLPAERLAILELRAARGWSLNQTADRLLVSTATVSSWTRRLDESGPGALVGTPGPVNKFPGFVAHMVRRLKVLCPNLGHVKIAQVLCRAGLHLGTTTVRRMLRETIEREGPETTPETTRKPAGGRIVGRYPHHVWHCDLTIVPTSQGLWTSSFPFALPQRWPFCWWVAVLADHHSRKILGFAVFFAQPTSEAMRAFLARVMRATRARPRRLVTDRGKQFRDGRFQAWCKRLGIEPRCGAIGQFGSIAVIERLIRTVKDEGLRPLLVPFGKAGVVRELSIFAEWYNSLRPHDRFGGATPDEIFEARRPAVAHPRFEPRRQWSRRSPCAAPRAEIAGPRGAELELRVSPYRGRRHLPIVTLRRVA